MGKSAHSHSHKALMAQGNTTKGTHTFRAKAGTTEEGATPSKSSEVDKPSDEAGQLKVTNVSKSLKSVRTTVDNGLQNGQSDEAQPTPETVKETQSNLEVETCTDVRQLQEEWYEIRSSTSKMSWADEVEAMPDPMKNHLSGIFFI
ncbi:hypothetical protein RDI58_007368 [Solanum bulbocastanum]|uniref:Uncharacterized protein n=1 Tax=Solanum bulbocastanum TaxID=147425 RepID=A0AAN8YIJ6_SOLBU